MQQAFPSDVPQPEWHWVAPVQQRPPHTSPAQHIQRS
jgi:hypothetical protein